MKRFRLLKKTRQTTEYSCGASALQAVLSYWGTDVDEEELMRLLGTTPEDGTYPEDLVRVARSLGFDAELRSNLTLDEVGRVTARGEPVIVLGQAWRSRRAGVTPLSEEWDCGHWFIALAVDREHVYFEDPYVRMGKGFLPRATFEEGWHNVMGGDRSKPEQIRMGIFIRGKERAVPARPRTDVARLDPERLGSLNLIVMQFEGELPPFDLVDDLKGILSTGAIRADAFILLRRDADGRLTAVEGGRVEDDEEVVAIHAVLNALAGLVRREGDGGGGADASGLAGDVVRSATRAASEADFGLSEAELRRIGERLPPAHSAVVVLLENLWERTLREVAAKHAGAVVSQRWIGPDELARLGRALRTADGT